jgi:hypothetical protein
VRFLLLIAICLFAAACVSTSVERLDHAARPARPPDSVSLLVEQPQRPYTVIAVIESKGKSVFDSFEDVRQEMIAEAAKLGGDAVLVGPESTDTDFILTGTAMIKSDTKKITGAVIVFDRR